MEAIIFFLLIVAGFILVLPIVAISMASGTRRKIEQLELEIYELRDLINSQQQTVQQEIRTQPEPAPKVVEPQVLPTPERTAEPVKFEQVIVEPPIEIQPPAAVEAEPPVEEPTTEEPTSPLGVDWSAWERLYAKRQELRGNAGLEPDTEPAPAPAPPPAPQPSKTREEWEMIIGGNIFNRIGAVAVILSMGFLLKYAFDHNWITPWLRVMMGFACGAGLIGLGLWFNKKGARIFSQGLNGAGIAVLYLAAYSSFNLYSLVPQSAAIFMMSAVTATAVAVSLKCDALVVAILGLAGGFLTPLMLDTGGGGGKGDWFGLFAYIALLDAGLLAVVIKKDSWAVLEPLAFIGTFLVYLVWHDQYYTPGDVLLTAGFLTVFWLLFYVMDVRRTFKRISTYLDLRMMISIANTLFYYIALYSDANKSAVLSPWLGLITLTIALAYFATALTAVRRQTDDPSFVARYLVTAIALLVVATALQFHGYTRISLWAVEALALTWCGLHWRMRSVWIPALLLFVAALSYHIAQDQVFGFRGTRDFIPVANMRFAAYSMLAVTLGAAAFLFGRERDEEKKSISAALNYLWCGLVIILIGVEINDYFEKLAMVRPGLVVGTYNENAKLFFMGLAWMLYSLPLMMFGLRRNITALAHSAVIALTLGVGLIAITSIGFDPRENFKPVTNIRCAVMLLGIALLLVQRLQMARFGSGLYWISSLTRLLDLAAILFGFELLTVEINSVFTSFEIKNVDTILGAHEDLAEALTLAIVWMAYSLPVIWLGLRKRLNTILYTALSILGLGVITAAVAGIEFAPRESFVLIANYRAAAIILSIIAVLISRMMLSKCSTDIPWAGRAVELFDMAISMLGFELLTVETMDYFRTVGSTWLGGIYFETARNLMLGIIWSIYSFVLVYCGHKKQSQELMMFGGIILALGLGTVAITGSEFKAVVNFTLLANLRAAAFAAAVIMLIVHQRYLARSFEDYPWKGQLLSVLRVITSLMIFELLTVETWDYFEKAIRLVSSQGSAVNISQQSHNLSNLQQMALSVVWVVYSVILMSYGIWKRSVSLRYVALTLFAITILKVFLSDLSYLDTLYRIFSFIALGLILLATSYLYQRYGNFIFGREVTDNTER